MDNSKGRSIAFVGVLTLISKFFAILRQIALTFFYGASSITDAFILAHSIPNTLFLLVVSAINISFIPLYSSIHRNKNQTEALEFTNKVISVIIILSSFIVVFSLAFTDQIIFLFASGFNSISSKIASDYLRISIFSIYFIGVTSVFVSFLKANNKFISISIIGISLSIVEILSYYLAFKHNDIILAYGIIVATFSQFLIVYFSSFRTGFRYKLPSNLFDENIKKLVILSVPIFISFGIDEVNVIIDKSIASNFGSGSISFLNYSNLIVSMLHTIITVSIYTVLFSNVSRYAASKEFHNIPNEIQKSINLALLFLIPSTIGIIFYSEPITQLVFERGNFIHSSTIITSKLIIFYSLSLIPNGVRMLTQTYFYALGKTIFSMKVGIVAVVINIVLNFLLSKILGLNGLALATSFSILVASIIHLYQFKIENKLFDFYKLFKINSVVLINSFISVGISYLFYSYFEIFIESNIVFIISVSLSVFLYFLLSLFTRTITIFELKRLFSRGKENNE